VCVWGGGGSKTLHLKGARETFFSSGFEGSQAVPAGPSGRGKFEKE
jgi:hypothetical protein